MATGNELTALRRRRGYCIGHFTRLSKKLDEIEQSGCPRENELIQIKNRLETYETELRAIQNEIVSIDEEEIERGLEIADEYEKLELRVITQLSNLRLITTSQSTNDESAAGRESASLKLPEIRIPTFDGTLENWQSFYDSFSSTIDQNEQLTPVQKFYHLRSALTGRAARSIQSLAITESNYAIAVDVLKEKFDCHRQICMRHLDLLLDYPKIVKETPEAIDDFLETFKINIQALENLGDPITSDTVLLKLLTSKLPPAIIRKWQRTLPDKKLPSYKHLIDFLQTRTNGDQTNAPTPMGKGDTYQHTRHRQNARHERTHITDWMWMCPTCKGSHELRYCKVFKAKSATKRLEVVKRASLCINCLGRGHSLTQCTSGSCHMCGQRHHTNLHRALTQVSPRISSDRASSDRYSSGGSTSGRSTSGRSTSGRSTSGRSSGDRSSGGRSPHNRSSKGRSPPGSSQQHFTHRSRRTTEFSRRSTQSTPKDRESHPPHESRASWNKGTDRSSSPKHQSKTRKN
ncbi:uncharacterized protein LOC143303078 [Bombus vancouverensis nearcticus]|uniref:uncharacterized protein LOC143303078 n=1 Tax=Bombus vancouverensis nearcticus TaxID=2705178 RepID=UPI00402BDF07